MDRTDRELKNKYYELFILGISIISLINLLLLFIPMSEEMRDVAEFYDVFLSLFLMGDFIFRLLSSPDKRDYLLKRFGWLDFLGSLPFVGLRLLRLFRVVRVIQLLGREGISNLVHYFREKRANTALFSVFFLILFSLEWASLGVLWLEPDAAGANIQTASDALWWAYVSITTVGYGDRFPVTSGGRVIGVLLLAIGVGLFGVLTSYLAEVFLSPRRARRKARSEQMDVEPRRQLAEIQALLEKQEEAYAQLKEKISQLEELI